MRICEVIHVKPKTPAQQRVQALQRNLDAARLALHRERELQRNQRAAQKLQRLQHQKPV
jgi:hypothetical protein